MTQRLFTNQYARAFYPWSVWLLGSAFFFYKYLVQVSPSVMTADLMQAFHLNGTGLGNLSACYFYAYLLMQIPVGILLDRFSPRWLTAVAILTCGISTLVFAYAHSLGLAGLARAVMGLAAAFAAVSCLKMTILWFPAKRFALISGLCVTVAMAGAVFGQLPLSFLVRTFNWRTALLVVGYGGIILSVIYFMVVRDKTQVRHTTQIAQTASLLDNFKSIMCSKQAWLLSLYSGLAFAPVSVFGGLWGVPFLQQMDHLTASEAAFAVSYLFIGFAIGAPLWGWISDAIQRRKPVMLVGTLLSLISLLIVIYYPMRELTGISALLFLFGFGTSGFFACFAMIREVFSITLAATVLGFMNTFDSICEAFSEPLVGMVLDWTWGGKIVGQVHQFSIQGYQLALFLLPLYLISALLVLIFIREHPSPRGG